MKMSGNTKWEITYEDEESVSVFKYNTDVSKNGPVSVEFRYKTGYKHPTEQKKKTIGELAKDARKQTRVKK
jgi:hypothetical protein